jgi:hypothetical protein
LRLDGMIVLPVHPRGRHGSGRRVRCGAGKLAAMLETARLAGFFAAHGIWNVSDGATLIPMLGYEHESGERGMDRFVSELGEAARVGQQRLQENPNGYCRAALVVDAYVHLDAGRIDALIVDAVEYGLRLRSLKMAVPYRPQPSPQGFAVHRPKFIEILGVPKEDYPALVDAFFAGVDSHDQAAAVWNAHHDPSI